MRFFWGGGAFAQTNHSLAANTFANKQLAMFDYVVGPVFIHWRVYANYVINAQVITP